MKQEKGPRLQSPSFFLSAWDCNLKPISGHFDWARAEMGQICNIAAFAGNYSILEARIFAENRSMHIFAENHRILQKPVCPI